MLPSTRKVSSYSYGMPCVLAQRTGTSGLKEGTRVLQFISNTTLLWLCRLCAEQEIVFLALICCRHRCPVVFPSAESIAFHLAGSEGRIFIWMQLWDPRTQTTPNPGLQQQQLPLGSRPGISEAKGKEKFRGELLMFCKKSFKWNESLAVQIM